MVAGGRASEEVVGQAERDEVFDDQSVVAVCKFASGHTFTVCCDEDRSTVFVASGHHQYVVSCHSHVSREDVGGHAESGNVSNVARTVGVRPSYCRQNTAHGSKDSAPSGIFRTRISPFPHRACSPCQWAQMTRIH